MLLYHKYFKTSARKFLLQSFLYLTLLCLSYASNAQTWEHSYGGGGKQIGIQMLETYDNGFAVLGRFDFTSSNNRILLIKTDVNGNILWTKNIGNTTYSNAPLGFDVTKDGGFYYIWNNFSI